MTLTIATVQSRILSDIRQNGAHLRALIAAAATSGARLVHLPEAALSGYVIEQIGGWAEVDWPALDDELAAVAALARQLGIWIVLGCNHRLPGSPGVPWPQNSLYVISDRGDVAARYNKRMLSNTERSWWYTPGADPVVFEVDGVRLGCALCIEVVFPQLFAEYERLGVECVLLSMYSADPCHGLMARAHAATNCYWISLSSPAIAGGQNPSGLIGPDGVVLAGCLPGLPGMVVQTIDRADPRFTIPLHHARPWRAHAAAAWAGALDASSGRDPIRVGT